MMKLGLPVLMAFLLVGVTPLYAANIFSVQEVERGAHHKVWQVLSTDAANPSQYLTNRYTEYRSGWHYWKNGVWNESKESITAGGVTSSATQCAFPTTFPQSLSTQDKLSLTTPDGQVLESMPVAIAYYDAASGKAVLLSALKYGFGQTVWPNQMMYQSAFSPLQADVRYTVTIAGLEQDVILRQRPPSPAAFGLNPSTTRLEIWTEFLNSPTPIRTPRILKPIPLPAEAASLVESNLVDEILDFGSMMMVSGNAFMAGNSTNSLGPVVKRWLTSNNRTYLIEGIEYLSISNALTSLPSSGSITPGTMPSRTALLRTLPPNLDIQSPLLAQTTILGPDAESRPGLVMDYLLVQYSSNITFKGDSTYLVSKPFYVAKNLTLEGGAIIKYGSSAKMHVVGGFTSQTAAYRPAIFTTIDDDTVGVGLPSFTSPTLCGVPALAMEGGDGLAHLRFRKMQTALSFLGGPYAINHMQWVQCQTALQAYSAEVAVRNALMDRVPVVLDGSGSVVQGEHWTVDSANYLNNATGNKLYLTNSILAAVSNQGAIAGSAAVQVFAHASVFESGGLGKHYLPTNSPMRDAGVATINAALAAELALRTTEAPQVISSDLSGDATFQPRVSPDMGTPDLGYHYEPLDYVWNPVTVNGSLVWENGVNMGLLDATGPAVAGSFDSTGLAANPNHLVRCAAVQESSPSTLATASTMRWLRLVSGARAHFEFSEVSMLGDGIERRTLFGSAPASSQLSAFSSRFENTRLEATADAISLALTNNLFRNATLIWGGASGSVQLELWNNLLVAGQAFWGSFAPESHVFDNLFDHVGLHLANAGIPPNGHNGYLGVAPLGGGAGDVVLEQFDYGTGVFGEFYQMSDSLTDAGSRSAVAAGLSSLTTRVSEMPEGNSMVDIGLHYPLSGGATHYPPIFQPLADQAIDEMTLLAIPLVVGDTNLPVQTVSLEILDPPVGMVISDNSILWTPSEEQGPGAYTISVVAQNNEGLALAVTQSCTITVREVNRAPLLVTPPDQNAYLGHLWTATNAASDPDIPANQLEFSLLDGPPGLSFETPTGVMRWTPTADQLYATYPVTVAVTDSGTPGLSTTQTFNLTVSLPKSPFTVVSTTEQGRGANQRQWQTVLQWQAANGLTYSATNQYVEQQSGLHYWDQGAWVEAKEEITPANNDWQAVQGQHRVYFPSFVTPGTGVQVTMMDGAVLKGFPYALAYYDAASGQSVKLDIATNSTALLAGTNALIYSNVFANVAADVRYVYTRAGLRQDVIWRQNPPSPALYGMDPASTRLEVWTEYYTAPTPARTPRTLKEIVSTNAAPVETQWTDERLDFGPMFMVMGKAYANNDANQLPFLVSKRWMTNESRSFLIEAVEYTAAASVLTNLPATGEIPNEPMPSRVSANSLDSTVSTLANKLTETASPAGLVIECMLANHETNFVYQSDTTYAINGPVYLSGQTVFEGGTVLKYGRQAQLHVVDALKCSATPYRPIVFTCRDDDTVGAILPTSTSYPEGFYAAPALALEGANFVQQARFRHAQSSLKWLGGVGYELRHAQITQGSQGIMALTASGAVRNALFNQASNVFLGSDAAFVGEHLTVDNASGLNGSPYASLALTNSILVNISTLGNLAAQEAVATANDTSTAFQTAGGGAHYLPNNSSWRNQGVATINPSLARELKELTTTAPELVDGAVAVNTIYAPIIPKDTGASDLGYHYPPLDYLWRSAWATATLEWQDGVNMGVLGTGGLVLSDGAQIISHGTPGNLNHLVHYSAVQENSIASVTPAYGQPGLVEMQAVSGVALDFRFTAMSGLGAQRSFVGGGGSPVNLILSDSLVEDSALVIGQTAMALTNNCLRRCQLAAGNASAPMGVYMFNNLLLQSTVWLGLLATDAAIYDNVFDGSALVHDGTLNQDFNGFVRCPTPSGGVHNVTLNQLDYTSGPMGDYYTASPPLINAGSRLASAAGLYHYTTSVGQAKEGASKVDIGLHYVAAKYRFDSFQDFTGTQGLNNWYAQYATAKGPVLGYINSYLPDYGWWWETSDSFCIVAQYMQHPGTLHDAVRAFVAPFEGEVQIDSEAIKAKTSGASDGTLMRILKNTETLVDWQPLNTHSIGTTNRLSTSLQTGDNLYFQLNRNAANNNDTTFWSAAITYTNASAQRVPWDLDGDGVPDYLEDSNGNGVVDNNETSYQFADSGRYSRKTLQLVSDGSSGSGLPSYSGLLGHWSLNDTNWLSDAGDPPLIARDLEIANSFDGNGIHFANTNNRAVLRIRERQVAGTGYNFDLTNGSIRFFYRPNWTGQAHNGTGPGSEITLLAIGDYTSPSGGLQIDIDQSGNTLGVLMGDGKSVQKYYATVHLYSNTWYHFGIHISSPPVASSYRLRVTQFETTVLDQTSTSPWLLPTSAARLNGLSFGSCLDGSQPAKGSIDEIDTYSIDIADLGYRLNNFSIAAQVANNPPQVTLSYIRGPNNSNTVQKRSTGETAWTTIDKSYSWSTTDTNVTAGNRYEYQLQPYGLVTGQSSITVGVQLPPVHYRGRILVLVDNTLASSIAAGLDQYLDDLRGDGWLPIRYNVPRHDDKCWSTGATNATYNQNLASVKSIIQQEYNAAPTEVKSVVLIGHVTIPYSGNFAEDGHSSPITDVLNHQGAWPADIYYGDIDGKWTDSIYNNVNPYNPVLQNLPGDGKFDPHFIVSPLELGVGRIDFANLAAFATPPAGVAPMSEVDLINQYLAKDHRYRQRQLSLPTQSMAAGLYVDKAVGENDSLYNNAVVNSTRWFGFAKNQILPGDCFTTPVPLLWGFLAGYGNLAAINGIAVRHTTADLTDPTKEPMVGFYLLGGSFFGDWNMTDSTFLRAVLGTPRYGLAAMWARGSQWRLETLGLGDTLGDALMRTTADTNQIRSCRTTCLMGDPALRFFPVAPPRSLAAAKGAGGTVTLTWLASVDAGVNYYVYRTPLEGVQPALLTAEPLNAVSYTDNSPLDGAATYWVRASRLAVTGSGSYTNLSQGVKAQVP